MNTVSIIYIVIHVNLASPNECDTKVIFHKQCHKISPKPHNKYHIYRQYVLALMSLQVEQQQTTAQQHAKGQ